jgi:hypothetical protein
MPARWSPQFNFYLARRDDAPVSVFMDMAAHDHLPLDSHACLVRVRVPLNHPRDDGLRSQDEFEAMVAVEERLVSSVERELDAIYWGRHVGGGVTDFFFAVDDDPGSELMTTLQPLLEIPGYSATAAFKNDPEWSEYRRSYPTPFLQHTISNRETQEQLRAMGDSLRRRRMIDHVALFPDSAAATRAAAVLRRARFRIGDQSGPDEDGAYALQFRRKGSCAGDAPDLFTAEILQLIEPMGGTYDGWGGELKR